MITNKLKINDSTTEFLIIASPHAHSKIISDLNLHVGNSVMKPSKSIKNLGVIIDKNLNVESQVPNICKSTHFHLRNIGSISFYLSDPSANQLVHSFLTSRLDYCNLLLIGLPDSQIHRLQRIQNSTAHGVLKIRKYDHIFPVLSQLHCLPVKKRTQFKMLLLTYWCLHGMAP